MSTQLSRVCGLVLVGVLLVACWEEASLKGVTHRLPRLSPRGQFDETSGKRLPGSKTRRDRARESVSGPDGVDASRHHHVIGPQFDLAESTPV